MQRSLRALADAESQSELERPVSARTKHFHYGDSNVFEDGGIKQLAPIDIAGWDGMPRLMFHTHANVYSPTASSTIIAVDRENPAHSINSTLDASLARLSRRGAVPVGEKRLPQASRVIGEPLFPWSLAKIKAAIGPWLEVTSGGIALACDEQFIDAQVFRVLARERVSDRSVADALAIWRGPALADADVPAQEAFKVWLAAERDSLLTLRTNLLKS